MPEIKILHIISYSSQDANFPIENLIKGSGAWLCSSDDRSASLRAEFQLVKATAIEYIDIGNSNTAMLSIEVGSSTWPSSQPFLPLLPTVVLISPADWRAGKNSKTVQMFKRENLDRSTSTKKWDRIRVICSNPFRKDTQYGLEFFKLFSQEDPNVKLCNNVDLQVNSLVEEGEKKSRFISHLNSNRKSTNTCLMSSSLRSLETSRMNAGDTDCYDSSSFTEIKSPMSRAAKLVMAKGHFPSHNDSMKEKKELEMEGLNFLISCNLTASDINTLKVSHIREEFELKRNKALSTREKLIFKNIALDFAAQRLKRMDDEACRSPETISLEPQSNTEYLRKFTSKKAFGFKLGISNGNISKTIINKSLKESSVEEFEKFKDNIFNRPVSSKRIRLREEENISPQAPSGADRNNLALDDCYVPPVSNNRVRKKLKGCNSHVSSSPPSNLEVWLSPSLEKNQTPKNLFQVKAKKTCRATKLNNCKEICTVDSSSESDSEISPMKPADFPDCRTSHTGFTIGNNPNDKVGIRKKKSNNAKSITLLECPLCTELFSADIIEEHASQCSTEQTNGPESVSKHKMVEECPICNEMFDATTIKEHAEECAEKFFS